ncbi:ubiquitin-protein ligase [Pelomyxa schiedti]|nr:ubiquitin-protein ligase [Pelomyxa schiedti]
MNDDALIAGIMGMGFSLTAATAAVSSGKTTLGGAVDFILSNPHLMAVVEETVAKPVSAPPLTPFTTAPSLTPPPHTESSVSMFPAEFGGAVTSSTTSSSIVCTPSNAGADDTDTIELPPEPEENTSMLDAVKADALSEEQLAGLLHSLVESCTKVTSLPFGQCVLVLKSFKWNQERMMEAFFEDPERILSKLGLPAEMLLPSGFGSCGVCGDDVLVSPESVNLPCAHIFCNECWAEYLRVKLFDENQGLNLTCMAPKCKSAVTIEHVKVAAPGLIDKYSKCMVRSLVEDNVYIKWCPSPGCSYALRSSLIKSPLVLCKCGFKMCFMCNEEAHFPANCAMLKKWLEKCRDDSETYHWIQVNTKICPKCKSAIEKNGGCNHMTCRNCRHEFCWLCFGDWHNHRACNKYTEDDVTKMHKESLDKYLFYYNRYYQHQQSSKFETELRSKALTTMTCLQSQNARLVDVEYVINAAEQLIECRRVMKNTYVLAFYMPSGAEKNLFEYLQQELEVCTEKLSELLESSKTVEKRRVVDTARLAHNRLVHLLEGVEEGLTGRSRH